MKKEPAPKLAEFAPTFTAAIETCAEKPVTVAFCRGKLKVLVNYLGGKRLDEIEEAEIEQYIQVRAGTKSRRKESLSPASVNRELATLRRLLRLAQEWKVLDRVPRIHLLRREHQHEFVLSHQKEALFLEAAEGRDDMWGVAIVLIDTGLRIRECLTLEWTDVRLEPAKVCSIATLLCGAGMQKIPGRATCHSRHGWWKFYSVAVRRAVGWSSIARTGSRYI